MSRIAVIDCGTNTFNLRIVDFNEKLGPSRWKDVFSLRLPVMLGKGGVGKGIILPERIVRGLDAIVMKKRFLIIVLSIFASICRMRQWKEFMRGDKLYGYGFT